MNKTVAKAAAQIMTVIILVAFIAKASIRLNAIEEKSLEVSKNTQMIRIIVTYIRLQDPELYKRAEQLAK